MSNSNRDEELEIIRQLLIATANRTESNSESIERSTDRMDHLTGRVDQLAIAQENTQANLDRLAIAQENTQANLDRLAIAQENTQANLDRLAIAQENTQANVDRLAIAQENTQANVDRLSDRIDQLAALTLRYVEDAEADRTIIRGLQAENRQILEYLFGQQQNGNGDRS